MDAGPHHVCQGLSITIHHEGVVIASPHCQIEGWLTSNVGGRRSTSKTTKRHYAACLVQPAPRERVCEFRFRVQEGPKGSKQTSLPLADHSLEHGRHMVLGFPDQNAGDERGPEQRPPPMQTVPPASALRVEPIGNAPGSTVPFPNKNGHPHGPSPYDVECPRTRTPRAVSTNPPQNRWCHRRCIARGGKQADGRAPHRGDEPPGPAVRGGNEIGCAMPFFGAEQKKSMTVLPLHRSVASRTWL